MKLKKVYFTTDSYITHKSEHTRVLVATATVSLELDMQTMSVRVDDRDPGGDGLYNVPLACIRAWFPTEERAPLKKAGGQ